MSGVLSALSIVAALGFGGFASSVEAASGTVVVTFSGEAYDGPPEFVVNFNGTAIGSGAVKAAIDTAKDGRLAAALRIEPFLQTFAFAVPDGVFDPQGVIGISFLNDAWGGEGSGLDRNLLIYSLLVNGRTVTTNDLKVTRLGEDVPRELIHGHLVLSTDGLVAAASAPVSGWPAEKQEAPVSAEQPPAVEAAEPVTEPVTPSAETTAAVVEEKTVEPAGTGGPICAVAALDITGFAKGSLAIPEAEIASLDTFLAGLPDGNCSIEVTSYSSTVGDVELDLIVAEGRAVFVLNYLKQHGASFLKETIVSFEKTNQFGPAEEANQRVILTVGP